MLQHEQHSDPASAANVPADALAVEEAPLESAAEQEAPVYTERSKGVRIFAWVLAILVILGVLLYFGWIAGILRV